MPALEPQAYLRCASSPSGRRSRPPCRSGCCHTRIARRNSGAQGIRRRGIDRVEVAESNLSRHLCRVRSAPVASHGGGTGARHQHKHCQYTAPSRAITHAQAPQRHSTTLRKSICPDRVLVSLQSSPSLASCWPPLFASPENQSMFEYRRLPAASLAC